MNLPSLQSNWVDLIILTVILYFISDAFRLSFWAILANFLSFTVSLLISLAGYQFAAGLLRSNFTLSHSFSNALGFFLTAVIIEGILGYTTVKLATKAPSGFIKKWWSKLLAIIPAAGEGIVFTGFLLTLFLALPVYPKVKADISEAKIGGLIVRKTSGLEARLDEIFGGIIEDSLTYFTIKPGSLEAIPLTVDRKEYRQDEPSELSMYDLINKERRIRGVDELDWDDGLRLVARNHALDMWERKYFGHLSPESEDVSDRLNEEGIKYQVAGENLALAPTVSTAHLGLMESPGHRENLLSRHFEKVGVGVIDNGIHGKIFVQVFTD